MTKPRQAGWRRRWKLLAGVALLLAGALLAMGWAETGSTRVAANAALKLHFLATPARFDELGQLSPSFDVSSTGDVALVPATGLAMVTASGDVATEAMGDRVVSGVAFDASDVLLGTSGGYFGRLNETGGIAEAVPLPYNAARLFHSAVPGMVYLAGEYGGEWRLYRFREGGNYDIVLATDGEIVGVAETPAHLLVALPRRVLRLKAGRIDTAFVAPSGKGFGAITGIAASPAGDTIVATAVAVWLVNAKGEADTLINDAGGALRGSGARFYVLDRQRKLLFYFTAGAYGGPG